MNLLKKILLYSLLLSSYNLYTQETPETSQAKIPILELPITSESAEKTAPVNEEPKKEEQKPEENKTEEKTELTNWQDYLKSVLVKGEGWEKANKTLSDDWQNKAFELAAAVIKKDISLADELITSFEDIIDKKFTTIEEITNHKGYSGVIDLFKDKIKALVAELSPKEKKEEDDTQVIQQENSSPEEPINEKNISESEAKTAEENIPEKEELSPTEKAEKKKEKRQSEWLECLENIKTGGVEEKEIQGILREAAHIAKKLLSSFSGIEQKDKADILKNEFQNAINGRSKELSRINESTAIAQFNNEIDTVVRNTHLEGQESFMNSNMIPQEDSSLQRNENNKPTAQQENRPEVVSKVIPTDQQQLASPQITYVASTTQTETTDQLFAQRQAEVAEKARIEAAKEQEQRKKQEELANSLKMKIAAAQAKTETKKGIISSIMEKVFGAWWTKESGTVEEMNKKQDALIANRVELFKDPAIKLRITNAYDLFQKTLLDFDSKKFWNLDEKISEPYKTQWLNNIKTASEILIRFNIMNVEIIISLLDEAFEEKTPAKQYKELIGLIKPGLEQYVAKLKEEEADIQRRDEEKLAIKQQENLDREKREKEEKRQAKEAEELAQQEAIKQQEQKRIAAVEQFAQSEREWKKLMQKIATSKPVSKDTNTEFTKKALQITESIFKDLSFIPKKNKKDITEKHIKEFSNAFIEQGKRNKGSNPHDGDPMGQFNARIHELAKK